MRYIAFIVSIALIMALTSCGINQQQTMKISQAHCSVHNYLQDAKCTPGDTLSNVATSQICTPGYAQSVRNVPQSEKDEVYAEYDITSHPAGAYEVDHLVSLEIGGSNNIKNLWPQSYTGSYNAHIKDSLEDFLHTQVCSGTLQLQCAQKAISSDWINAYNEMIKKQQINC